MDRSDQYHIVKTTEVRESRDGSSRAQFVEGTSVPASTAYEYGLAGEDAPFVSARPDGEEPDVAPNDDPVFTTTDDGEVRANKNAPENKAKQSVSENRAAKQGA
jgi:hypothetical protein